MQATRMLKKIFALPVEPFILLIRYIVAKVRLDDKTVPHVLKQRAILDSAEFIEANLRDALLFDSKKAFWDYAVSLPRISGLHVELGVFKGQSINYFAERCPEVTFFGFDSFNGLAESWSGTDLAVGSFDLNLKEPRVRKNVRLIKGYFEDTLPNFAASQNENLSLIHFDADTYYSTKYALSVFKSKMVIGSLVMFDEYHGYPNWRNGEFRAWAEFAAESKLNFRYLAFAEQQVLIGIV